MRLAPWRVYNNDGLREERCDNPIINVINDGGILNTPINISMVSEGGNFYGLISNSRVDEANTAVYKVDFGPSLSDLDALFDKYFFSEMTGGVYALEVANMKSEWYAFTFSLAKRDLIRFNFENPCSAIPTTSVDLEPTVLYTEEGEYYISVMTTNSVGNNSVITKSVNVTGQTAPDINFTSQNICQTAPVAFTSANTSGNINSYSWDFGDANTSTNANPNHSSFSPSFSFYPSINTFCIIFSNFVLFCLVGFVVF